MQRYNWGSSNNNAETKEKLKLNKIEYFEKEINEKKRKKSFGKKIEKNEKKTQKIFFLENFFGWKIFSEKNSTYGPLHITF